ncbi:MAG: hypothetical protein ACYS8W_12315 [Planctomycetota bacterium]|jgi:hypothetical protein
MQISDALNRKLKAVKMRITWNRRLVRFAWISLIGSCVALCYMVASRFAYFGNPLVTAAIIVGVCIVFGFLVSILFSASLFHAALRTDEKYALNERVSTAYSLLNSMACRNNSFTAAVVNDANSVASGIKPETVAPFRMPPAAMVIGVVFVLIFALSLIPPTYARQREFELERQIAYTRISVYLGQAGEEIRRISPNRSGSVKLAEEAERLAELIRRNPDAAALRELAGKVADMRAKLDEKKRIIRHFEETRLLSDFAQVLKMGIPARSREAADRLGRRLRANPRSALGSDTERAIKRLLGQMKNDSRLRRDLAEAEAALAEGRIGEFEDALARLGGRFMSDIDEQSVSLAEAVVKAADMKLVEAGEPGILVGSPDSIPRTAKQHVPAAPVVHSGAEVIEPAAPVDTVHIPERFRPVVQKYFARKSK